METEEQIIVENSKGVYPKQEEKSYFSFITMDFEKSIDKNIGYLLIS